MLISVRSTADIGPGQETVEVSLIPTSPTGAANDWASRWKRLTRSGSQEYSSGRILTATSRLSFVSRPRYTSPIPPLPSNDVIWYEPKCSPISATLRPRFWTLPTLRTPAYFTYLRLRPALFKIRYVRACSKSSTLTRRLVPSRWDTLLMLTRTSIRRRA